MRKKFRVGEMKMARALVRKYISYARDEIMELEVTMVTLVQGMKTEEVSHGA
jgi:hypothetical protein